jgi:hypothetical protein
MLVFRSEAHTTRWLAGRPPGATISVSKLAALAEAWWWDRLASDWRPRSREESQAILDRLGLVGDFWRLG